MTITFGIKAHSGWAALVALGKTGSRVLVTDRHRMKLADLAGGVWARQPYHAAEGLPPAQARKVVADGVARARQLAVSEMKAALTRAKLAGHTVSACAVLIGTPMAKWSVDEILAVHVRMHMAEGALYRNVLLDAARSCKLRVVEVPVKGVVVTKLVEGLKSQVGAPWGMDQKHAALAALVALDPKASESQGKR